MGLIMAASVLVILIVGAALLRHGPARVRIATVSPVPAGAMLNAACAGLTGRFVFGVPALALPDLSETAGLAATLKAGTISMGLFTFNSSAIIFLALALFGA